jgi:hypothetical protein
VAKKSKKETPIAKTDGGGPLAVPDFMQEVEDLGIDDLGQFIVPPRIKIVQRQSGEEFLNLFEPGDVVIVPQMVKIAGMAEKDTGEPFFFVPLFFFAEWVTWNPLEMKGVLNAVRERSTDPASPLAAKCRQQSLWYEPCPENKEYSLRNVEHLNYVVTLVGDHELAGTPMVISFSKSEHRSGTNLAALVKMRKAPIFGCQFMGIVGHRSNNKGNWFGVDVTNPAGDSGVTPFIAEQELFEKFQELHEDLKSAHADSKIKVDYDDDAPAAPGDSSGDF